ncbi:MAG: hypothetical protein ACE5KM_17115 [Planctomycetaceae bacterium]
MAGDNFRKRRSGDLFTMKAPLYNALIDAARRTKQNRHDVAGNFQPEFRSSTIVAIRNSSGVDRPRNGILGVAGPIIAPADNIDEFRLRVALDGTAPTLAHVGRWAVLIEPLAAGAIGRAVVSGLAICQIAMRNAGHQYVEINAAGLLESGDSGSARIVWVENTTGTQWAVINIDAPRTLQAKFELIDDLEEGGTANAFLLYQDNLGNWRRVTPTVTVSVNAGDYSVENPPNDDRSGSSFTGVKFGGADAGNSGDVVEAVGWIEGTTLRWFAIGAGHKVVTGTNVTGLLKNAVGTLSVDLQGVDTRNITVSAKALSDIDAGAKVIAWWNGPLRQWHMAELSQLSYEAGCGIVINEAVDPPTIAVNTLSLIGPGLAPSGTCGLTVVPGCGIQVGTDVAVDPPALAGQGLVPAALGCALDVNPGCGIRVVADKVKFEPLDVVGAALGKVGDCGIDVLYACGLFINGNNELEVDPDDLAGAGLVSAGVGCAIQVSTGCGLVFGTIDELEVDLRGFDGPGLLPWQDPASGCWGLQVDCNWIETNCNVGAGPTAGCGLIDNAGVFDVDPIQLSGNGLLPAAAGCALDVDCDYIKTTCLGGFTGTKTVYVDDGFGGQTTEDWTFDNGVLMDVVPTPPPPPP